MYDENILLKEDNVIMCLYLWLTFIVFIYTFKKIALFTRIHNNLYWIKHPLALWSPKKGGQLLVYLNRTKNQTLIGEDLYSYDKQLKI